MLDAQVQQVWKTPEHWGIINVVQGCIEMMAVSFDVAREPTCPD